MEIIFDYELSDIIKAVALTVLCVLALWETGKKIVEILNAYYKKKKAVDKHSENVKSLSDNDKQQDEMIHILLQATKVQMRHSIVRIGEESLKKGCIGAYELQSLEDLFETYCHDLNGNSYVHTMMDKVRELPIDYTNGNPERGEIYERKVI